MQKPNQFDNTNSTENENFPDLSRSNIEDHTKTLIDARRDIGTAIEWRNTYFVGFQEVFPNSRQLHLSVLIANDFQDLLMGMIKIYVALREKTTQTTQYSAVYLRNLLSLEEEVSDATDGLNFSERIKSAQLSNEDSFIALGALGAGYLIMLPFESGEHALDPGIKDAVELVAYCNVYAKDHWHTKFTPLLICESKPTSSAYDRKVLELYKGVAAIIDSKSFGATGN
jgi:hypothetical protein